MVTFLNWIQNSVHLIPIVKYSKYGKIAKILTVISAYETDIPFSDFLKITAHYCTELVCLLNLMGQSHKIVDFGVVLQ